MQQELTSSKTILWADDDTDDLELFPHVLNELAPGHQLLQFENGRELLDFLQGTENANNSCLIILDINMPVLNGRDTLRMIKQDQRFSAIPVVVFTTSNSSLDKAFCKWMHTEMLTKPFTYEALKEVLQKLLSYCR